MNQIKITSILLFFFLSLDTSSFAQTTAKDEVANARKTIEEIGNRFNWESFDSTSKVGIDNIKIENLQGLWKAYNGLFRFGTMVNSMDLTQPMIFEVKTYKERRSTSSKFEKFTIDKNKITSKKGNDFGFINKITDSLIVITWKSDDNYTRYYYEK